MMRVAAKPVISKDRAERIAKAHACENCGEYSYKKLVVKPSTLSQKKELKETWHAFKICGVCGLEHEMGIDAEGEVLYVN
jgi:transcription elongation factor Elf1